jgi:arylamine N-acetyltransferase
MHTTTLTDWPTASVTLRRLSDWVKARTLAGRPVTLTVADAPRTLPQNAHIHPVVRRICAALGRTDEDVVRALLVEQWRHETRRPRQYVPSLDGARMVDVSNRTSAMDKHECSEFLDWLLAFEAQQ